MSRRVPLLEVAGLALTAAGFFLSRPGPYEVRTVVATAGGCRMVTDMYEPRTGTAAGSVVLFHGLAANRKLMAFLAEGFVEQDLRVFVPDLVGHGKTPGPYSASRAEACAASFVRDLAARKAVVPARTLLAGHSLGGALALRVAAGFPVAGVVAFSPAPMQVAPGLFPEMLPFQGAPPLPPHTLVLAASWEPFSIRRIGEQMVAASGDPAGRFVLVPRTTHVSILFSRATFETVRDWTSALLGTTREAPLPTGMPALGCILGLIGLCLIAPPLLRETVPEGPGPDPAGAAPWPRAAGELALLSALAVAALRFVPPFRFLHLFQGDYLVSFLFTVGSGALVLRRRSLPPVRSFFALPPAVSALVLALLVAAWLELTFYEAWYTFGRAARLPLVLLLCLPWHLAEELLLGPAARSPSFRRLAKAFAFRAALVAALLAGLFLLHSGQVLFVLLGGYFVLFSFLQRLATDAIRFRTRSPAAAAVFGAILLAAFALAIFPVA
jgi:pimeloyl-ACP methyl ester carboxylesterase